MLLLKRTYLRNATHGSLYAGTEHIAFAVELPWRENKRRQSCIPEGDYVLRKRFSQKFGWHCVVVEVPQRSGILIHPANDAQRELLGCIAPVTSFAGEGIGTESRKAMKRLMSFFDREKKNGCVPLRIMSEGGIPHRSCPEWDE